MQLTEHKTPEEPVEFKTLKEWTYFVNQYKNKLFLKVPKFPNHDNVIEIDSKYYSVYLENAKVYPVRLVGATYELL